MSFNPDSSKLAQEVIFRWKSKKVSHLPLFFIRHYFLLYIFFVRHHLDYGDIIYEEVYDVSFHYKRELFQYSACLAITQAIIGTSKEKLYQELRLESLQLGCWFRKLCFFCKIFKNIEPGYLSNLVPQWNFAFNTRNLDQVHFFK